MRLATSIRAHGIQSTAFIPRGAPLVEQLFRSSGIPTVEFEPREPSYRRPGAYIGSSAELAREFGRRGVDLVHCADLLGGFNAGLAGRLARLPVLCHVRCAFGEMSRRDRSFLRLVHRFIFVSEHSRESFGRSVPFGAGTVLYDGIEVAREPGRSARQVALDVRSELGIPENAPVVGMVARVAPVKDFETLARAARRLLAVVPDARFLVVGDHSSAAAYREHYAGIVRLLAELGVGDQFTFTGHRRDVDRLLQAMDVVALVTHSEGFGLVLLEAMAAGRPVVGTAVGGVPEIIRDGECGFLHAHGDDSELAEKLRVLLQDPALARRTAAAALNRVQEHFSDEVFARGAVDLYAEALLSRERTRPR